MSEHAEPHRRAMKAKARRLAGGDSDSKTGCHSSIPEAFDGGRKTGPKRPVRRTFKRGGKVEGEHAKHHAGKKPRSRKAFGGPLTGAGGLAPGQMPMAPGGAGMGQMGPMGRFDGRFRDRMQGMQPPVGVMQPLAAPTAMAGAPPPAPMAPAAGTTMMSPGGPGGAGPIAAPGYAPTAAMTRKRGGRTKHADEAEDKALVRKMVKKDCVREGRKHGGRTKGKMNVNIIVGQPGGMMARPPMPPAPPPQSIPVPMPPAPPPAPPMGAAPPGGGFGGPMQRKAGGRIPKTGAGGGLARLA